MSAAQTGGEAPCWACRFHAAPREHALWRSLLGCSSEFQTDGRRAQAWLRRAQACTAQRIVRLAAHFGERSSGFVSLIRRGAKTDRGPAGFAGVLLLVFRPHDLCCGVRARGTRYMCGAPRLPAPHRLSPRVDRKTPPRPAARRGRSCRRWQCRRSSGSTIQSWPRAPRPYPCAGPPRRRQRRGCHRPPSTT